MAHREHASDSEHNLVSVVIVNWNTRDLLNACLDSLEPGGRDRPLEIIVVDNGSTDGSARMIAERFPSVRLIPNDANLGFVRANNQGLAVARGELLFMLNSDTQVHAGCIARLAEVLQSEERIGAVGPRLLNSDGTHQRSFGPFPSLLHRLLPGRFEARYAARVEGRQARGQHTVDVAWLSGAALMTRRDVIDCVGPLDERYFMWWDDLDWSQKLRRAGYRRVLVTDAVVTHHGRQSGRAVEDRRLAEQLLDSEYTYLRLNHGRLTTVAAFALRLLKAALSRLLPGPPNRRDEAAWRLAYHRRRFARFCVRSMPPRPPEATRG